MVNANPSRTSLLLPLLGLCLGLLAGCGSPDEGFGVVLWGGNTFSLRPGVIVDIHDEHKLDDTLTVSLKEDEVRFEVQQGYIKRCASLEEAERFHSAYEEYFDLFARSKIDGLLVRQKPSQTSRQVYRLRKGEKVKVVLAEDSEKRVEGRMGTWYLVVTEDGYQGYSFGPYLYFHSRGEEISKYREQDKEGALLEQLCGTVWRPAYMQQGLEKERINLERLDPRIGLFPDKDARSLKLRTKEFRRSYSLHAQDTARAGDRTLRIENGALTLEFISSDALMAEYEYRGKIVRDRFVRLDVELETRIKEERRRRKKLYSSFLEKNGNSFRSESYGRLRFSEDGSVRWTHRYDLPRRVLPLDAGESGEVQFDLYLAEPFEQEYDGAFSMIFPVGNRESRVHFLYRWLSGGLQLTYVREEAIHKQMIKDTRGLALILYFKSLSESAAE
jgi:hypothetical protein